VKAHLAEPADTAAARGRKKRAKTDRADSKLIRELLDGGRIPECWIPPSLVLECRALLGLYHDLRREHTAWIQRIHAVLFHQGAEALGGGISTEEGRVRLRQVAAEQLSPAGQLQVATAVAMLEMLEVHLDDLRRRLVRTARQLRGPKTLAEAIYGVGPITGLALCCWLGGADRFGSSRKAVRFAGLDVTVYSSDGKRSPGHLSRRCCAGASTRQARPPPGPAPPTTATTHRSRSAWTGNALLCPRPAVSSGRPATCSPPSATTRSPRCEPPQWSLKGVDDADTGTATVPMGHHAASSCNWAVRPHPPSGTADGLQRLSGRTPAGGGHPIHHHVAGLGTVARGPR
jgi:hypothetical protein